MEGPTSPAAGSTRPVPVVSDYARPYWEGAAEGVLRLQRCEECQAHQYPPRAVCRGCWSDSLVWDEVTGRGTIYSFTTVHRPPSSDFSHFVPYVVGLIDLSEGPRLMSNIVDSHADKIVIGAPVEVLFEPLSAEMALPMFRIAT